MSITAGHFRLTEDQKQFKKLLSNYPTLLPYWDFATRELRLEEFEKKLGALSHGEQIIGRFFAAVWLGEDQFRFDFIEAAKSLNDGDRAIIVSWLADPFFP